jgi:hypothetical protein
MPCLNPPRTALICRKKSKEGTEVHSLAEYSLVQPYDGAASCSYRHARFSPLVRAYTNLGIRLRLLVLDKKSNCS